MTDIKNALNQWLEQASGKRQHLSHDPHRPHYHFLPPANWMNDPNGLIYWKGKYHMFYQHNPNNPFWGDIHWGHTVSDDLVHWKDLPPALSPDMPPADNSGCWSGCAVNDKGVPTFLYTGVKDGEQTTCIATGNDDLLVWQKDASNPVERAPKLPGFRHQDYRDPYVWREGDTWYQVISMSIDNQGQVLIYRSTDLRNWEYLHPLIPPDVRQNIQDEADIWECPNFFPLGDKWVLMVSIWKNHTLLYPAAYIGDFRDLHFYPETFQRLDWGEQCMYAPLTFEANNRRLFFGWMQEQRSRESQIAAGWSGVMSVPRVLTLENNRICSTPAPEIQHLRTNEMILKDKHLRSNQAHVLNVQGQALELQLTLELSDAAIFTLSLGTEQEKTLIRYDHVKGELSLDTRGTNASHGQVFTAPHPVKDNLLHLHIFLDHSTLEMFANKTTCISGRIYPAGSGDTTVQLLAEQKEINLQQASIWTLKSIWDNS